MSIHTKSLLVGASTLASVLAVQQASADTSLETVTEPVEKVQIPENLPQGDPLPDIVENGLAPKLKGSQSILTNQRLQALICAMSVEMVPIFEKSM